MADISDKYKGKTAQEYERKRVNTKKWKNEQRAVECFLSEYSPKTVLDVPVGTGRFIPQYISGGIQFHGIDTSEAMLSLAIDKARGTTVPHILEKGDILNLDVEDNAYECIVCVRFLNWMGCDQVKTILTEFERISQKYIMLDIRLSDKCKFTGKGIHPHSSEEFYGLLEVLNLQVLESKAVDTARSGSVKHVFLIGTIN